MLRYEEDLPPREIALRLGLSGVVARKRLSRALAKLRVGAGGDRRGARDRGASARGSSCRPSSTQARPRGRALAAGPPSRSGSPRRSHLGVARSLAPRARAAGDRAAVARARRRARGPPRRRPPLRHRGRAPRRRVARARVRSHRTWTRPPPRTPRPRSRPNRSAPASPDRNRRARHRRRSERRSGGRRSRSSSSSGEPRSNLGRPWSFKPDAGDRIDAAAADAKARTDAAGEFELEVPAGRAGRVAVGRRALRPRRRRGEVRQRPRPPRQPRRRGAATPDRRARRRSRAGAPVGGALVVFESGGVSLTGSRNPFLVHPNTQSRTRSGAFELPGGVRRRRRGRSWSSHPGPRQCARAPLADVRSELVVELYEPAVIRLSTGGRSSSIPKGHAVPDALVSVHGRLVRTNDAGRFPLDARARRPSARRFAPSRPGYLPTHWEPATGRRAADGGPGSGSGAPARRTPPLPARACRGRARRCRSPAATSGSPTPPRSASSTSPGSSRCSPPPVRTSSTKGTTDADGRRRDPRPDATGPTACASSTAATSTLAETSATPGLRVSSCFELEASRRTSIPRGGRVVTKTGDPRSPACASRPS